MPATPTWKKWQLIMQLYNTWKQFPELRLGQLIDNVMPNSNHAIDKVPVYYITDDNLAAQLDWYLKRYKPLKNKRLRKSKISS